MSCFAALSTARLQQLYRTIMATPTKAAEDRDVITAVLPPLTPEELLSLEMADPLH